MQLSKTKIVTASLLASAALALTTAALALAAAPVTGSIKIGIPRHIQVGKAYTVHLTGFTSHPKSSVTMFAQRTKCPSQVDKVGSNAGIVFPGGTATGHFKFSDRIGYPTASHGPVTYCAYLYYSPPPYTKEITIAHCSARYRIPS